MSGAPAETLEGAALAVLLCADPWRKAALTAEAAAAWRAGVLAPDPAPPVAPDRPARPARPDLRPPRDMPKRSTGARGQLAFLHALAHIELNAIDLAWDIILRFRAACDLPRAFAEDWVAVAADEARHFLLLDDLMAARGARYGDLPAHDGLWMAARASAHDLAARLVGVPLLHEARGLDTTPAAVDRMRAAGQADIAEGLEVIARDEVGHVAAGARWLRHEAARRGVDPARLYRDCLETLPGPRPKPPFNTALRDAAGLPAAWYDPDGAGCHSGIGPIPR